MRLLLEGLGINMSQDQRRQHTHQVFMKLKNHPPLIMKEEMNLRLEVKNIKAQAVQDVIQSEKGSSREDKNGSYEAEEEVVEPIVVPLRRSTQMKKDSSS